MSTYILNVYYQSINRISSTYTAPHRTVPHRTLLCPLPYPIFKVKFHLKSVVIKINISYETLELDMNTLPYPILPYRTVIYKIDTPSETFPILIDHIERIPVLSCPVLPCPILPCLIVPALPALPYPYHHPHPYPYTSLIPIISCYYWTI